MEKNHCLHFHIFSLLFPTQFKSTMKIKTRLIILKELYLKWWKYWTRTTRLKMEISISFWLQLFLELCSFNNKCTSKLICFSLERWISSFDTLVRKKIILSLSNHIFIWLYFIKLSKTTVHLNLCGSNAWKFIKESMETENGTSHQIIRILVLANLLKEKHKEQLKAS